jgi:hypothetical protein
LVYKFWRWEKLLPLPGIEPCIIQPIASHTYFNISTNFPVLENCSVIKPSIFTGKIFCQNYEDEKEYKF